MASTSYHSLHFHGRSLINVFILYCSRCWSITSFGTIIVIDIVLEVRGLLALLSNEAFRVSLVVTAGYTAIAKLFGLTVIGIYFIVPLYWLQTIRNRSILIRLLDSISSATLDSSALEWRSEWQNTILRTDQAAHFFMCLSGKVKIFRFIAFSKRTELRD